MELDAEELTLIECFREHAADKRRAKLEVEAMQLERDDQKHKEEHRKREEKEEQEHEEALRATTAQIAEFDRKLDDYDTATVHALMINQEKLDDVLLRLDRTEGAAYRLPDGRAVFKTTDGRHVFDKSGVEVSHDEVRPEDISKDRPSWEAWQVDKAVERDLLRQRDDIHAYQHRLDQAREQSGQKGVSTEALAKMDADLKASMPKAVRDAREHPDGTPEHARTDDREPYRAFQPFDKPITAPVARPSPM